MVSVVCAIVAVWVVLGIGFYIGRFVGESGLDDLDEQGKRLTREANAKIADLKRRLTWQTVHDGKRYTVRTYEQIGEATDLLIRELWALTKVGAETDHQGRLSALMVKRDEAGTPLLDVVMEEDLPDLKAKAEVVDLTARKSSRYTPPALGSWAHDPHRETYAERTARLYGLTGR